MRIARPKTERWHNYAEGDTARPIDRKGKHLFFYKKGFWKRYDRKKFFRDLLPPIHPNEVTNTKSEKSDNRKSPKGYNVC